MTTPEIYDEAFVTLATNDSYSLGCLVLGRSLRRTNTHRRLVVMITHGVSQPMINQLQMIFDLVYTVDLLDSQDPSNLQLLGRPDLNVTFTKLHCWRLTQYRKAVFLDADTMVLRNIDELFEREELSAAPDAGWPDCFNSGVFVYRPSMETYKSLLHYALTHGSFDGGDQGLLNSYFSDWSTKDIAKHLPFVYNVVSQAFYSYLPAFTKFRDCVCIVHFIGPLKPWHHLFDPLTGHVTLSPNTEHNVDFLKMWWAIFISDVQPLLSPELPTENCEELEIVFHYSRVQLNSQPDNCGISISPLVKYSPITSHGATYSDSEVNSHDVMNSENILKSRNLIYSNRIIYVDSINSSREINSNHIKKLENTSFHNVIHSDIPVKLNDETHSVLGRTSNITSDDSKSETDIKCCEKTELHENLETTLGCDISRDTTVVPVVRTEDDIIGQLMSSGGRGDATTTQVCISDSERKQAWERGEIDYLGSDSFENIQKKLDDTIERGSSESIVLASKAPFPTVRGSFSPSTVTAASGKLTVGDVKLQVDTNDNDPISGGVLFKVDTPVGDDSSQLPLAAKPSNSQLINPKFKHPDLKPLKTRIKSESESSNKSPLASPIAHPDFINPLTENLDSPVSSIRVGIAAADQWKPENRMQVAGRKNIRALRVPASPTSELSPQRYKPPSEFRH